MENKGFTLVELIISIALISIVVMFLFNLLTDVKASNNNTDFNRKNQQKRAIIIKNIQADLTNRKLVGISDSSPSDGKQVSITFQFQDGTSYLTIVNDGENQSITYENASGIEKWNLEKQTKTTKFNTTCITYINSFFDNNSEELKNSEYFYIKINIPIIVNKNKANNIDDIELFYIGLKKDLTAYEIDNFNRITLGAYQENTCEKKTVN